MHYITSGYYTYMDALNRKALGKSTFAAFSLVLTERGEDLLDLLIFILLSSIEKRVVTFKKHDSFHAQGNLNRSHKCKVEVVF